MQTTATEFYDHVLHGFRKEKKKYLDKLVPILDEPAHTVEAIRYLEQVETINKAMVGLALSAAKDCPQYTPKLDENPPWFEPLVTAQREKDQVDATFPSWLVTKPATAHSLDWL